MMTIKEVADIIKILSAQEKDLWIEGKNVSFFHDKEDQVYTVMQVNDETYDIEEFNFTEEELESAVEKFLFLFNNDRISLTDEECNV